MTNKTKEKINKTYEIKTIQELCEVVTNENVEDLIKDIAAFLRLIAPIMALSRLTGEKNGVVVEKFTWKDDHKPGDFSGSTIKIRQKDTL